MTREAQALVVATLRYDADPRDVVPPAQTDWQAVLQYCDRYHLTLPFGRRVVHCPDAIRERLRENARANTIRQATVLKTYAHLQSHLSGIEHLVLKGFSLAPDFCPGADSRVQYDLDLYCPATDVLAARAALLAIGYESLEGTETLPTDHVPPLIRKTGWQWRGDYFDTEIPLAVELHFRFWDEATERFGPSSLEDFWTRRQLRQCEELRYWSLSKPDALGYAALHALRHLLRGDPRPNHFLEIGYFLEQQPEEDFWQRWYHDHHPSLRRIQAICFRFAHEWFGCRLPQAAAEAVQDLPEPIEAWFQHWARSPLESCFRPNKHELWLHLCLLDRSWDKAVAARRKLLPLNAPGHVDAVHVPGHQLTLALRIRRRYRQLSFALTRVWHHARTLLPTVAEGIGWFFARHGLTPEFWRFFRGFVLFNAALMIFHLLYNLHLVSIGFTEEFIGKVSSTMTMGSIAGSIAAGLFLTRIGLRSGLVLTFLSQGIFSALRVAATSPAPLLRFAFLSGVSQSFYATCLLPAVAALTGERNRAFAYSITMATGISLGVGAGVTAGQLAAALGSTRAVLWLVCPMAAMAAIPLLRLRMGDAKTARLRDFIPDSFLCRLLPALALWGLATGIFNPFFNVFLARAMQFPVQTIGLLFTISQAAQVVAILASPAVLRRLGMVRGIALMQAVTGIALAALGFATPATAMLLYPLYMSFQYMSEPGIFTLLMTGVPEQQRAAASAWNFLVLFASHALAAWVAGVAIARLGYTPVLLTGGLLCLCAASAMMLVMRSRKISNV